MVIQWPHCGATGEQGALSAPTTSIQASVKTPEIVIISALILVTFASLGSRSLTKPTFPDAYARHDCESWFTSSLIAHMPSL